MLSLQTEQPRLATPYFSDDHEAVSISPRAPGRHILAGLAQAVGGVPPPYRAPLPGGGASLDFAWATGHHPFGPFANGSAFSQAS